MELGHNSDSDQKSTPTADSPQLQSERHEGLNLGTDKNPKEVPTHLPMEAAEVVIDAIGDEREREREVSVPYVGAGGEDCVVNFDGIAILTPRGRYNIELHLSFLRLQGQANDFNIQYNSVVRVFWLPKSNQPHTFVVVTLDPPIREGQTLYPHIVMQFETDAATEKTLSMCEELYNAKYKDKLKLEHKGLVHEIFTEILSGLSEAKVTKPGKFHSRQDGYAVNYSLKDEDGFLFPLEEGFFSLPDPPTLILHEEIDYVEFERHTARGSIIHYFHLLIKLKSEQEHRFRNIQRNVFLNLYLFIVNKGLKIMNLGTLKIAEEVPTHLSNIEAIGDECYEEDFAAERRDKGYVNLRKRACPFMLFSNCEKKELVKSNPGISLSELGKELGERWRKMTAEEKSVYEAKALGLMNT